MGYRAFRPMTAAVAMATSVIVVSGTAAEASAAQVLGLPAALISGTVAASDPATEPTEPTAPNTASAPTAGSPQTSVVDARSRKASAEEASVERVEWLSTRRVKLTIKSPAMQDLMSVQLLLARDWNKYPDQKFPTITLLDGMRASDKENGWTLETNLDSVVADKNVTVVMPIGGKASFYTNWEQSPQGEGTMQWETFLVKELRGLLQKNWRATEKAGIAGISMGGTAAVTLAERHPELYDFVGSFSGVLDTTSFGMPDLIDLSLREVKPGHHAEDMWGEIGNENWKNHDPKLGVSRLRGKTVYVTSGTGNTGPYDTPSKRNPRIPTNTAGFGVEIMSHLTSETFVSRARAAGVNVITKFRSVGTHSWPYWQFEFDQALPDMARALGTSAAGSNCAIHGEIAKAVKGNKTLNGCITDEYAVKGGVAQDFRGGRVLWSKSSGAHTIKGAIGSYYQIKGGPKGTLGLPVSDEFPTPDRKGAFQRFQHGIIYWTPQIGAYQVSGDNIKTYGTHSYERGPLGYPLTDEAPLPKTKGTVQRFQGGSIYWSPKTGSHVVRGLIFEKYRTMDYENGPAGLPLSDEVALKGGAMSVFQNGKIYWSPETGTHWVPLGAIFDMWGKRHYEQGELGWPTSDETETDGVRKITFQHGEITTTNGKTEVRKY